MLVQPQVAAEEEDEEDEVHADPTHEPLPPPHEPITSSLQAQPALPSSPPQAQPTTTYAPDMTLLNTFWATASIKKVNDVVKLQALIDKNKVVGRIERKDDDNDAAKEVNAAEPTVFDDEEVTMTMAQTLIMMKAEKARILDEQMAKRLYDEEVEQAMQEKHLDNIMKYQSLKRKPIFVAQSRKNMIVYLKNMAGYKMAHFKGMTYDQLRAEVKVSASKSTQDTPTIDPKEMSKEDVQNMLQIVPVSKFKGEALQVKHDIFMFTEKDYPLTDVVMNLMLSTKLQVDKDCEMARDLMIKIFMEANKLKSKRNTKTGDVQLSVQNEDDPEPQSLSCPIPAPELVISGGRMDREQNNVKAVKVISRPASRQRSITPTEPQIAMSKRPRSIERSITPIEPQIPMPKRQRSLDNPVVVAQDQLHSAQTAAVHPPFLYLICAYSLGHKGMPLEL
nr:hypothetical protein [Tanacetum cinerariifolium]